MVICEQHSNGIKTETVIPELVGVGRCGEEIVEREGETDAEILDRKLQGAIYHGWEVEVISDTEFHAWKEYPDGSRKDRYFKIWP